MNRKKKVKQTLLKQVKKQRAKSAANSNKPKYISKAERAAMAEAESSDAAVNQEEASASSEQ